MENKNTKQIVKTAIAGVVSAAVIAGTIISSIGLSNNSKKFDEIDSAIASLTKSAEVGALANQVSGISDKVDATATSTQIAELAAQLSNASTGEEITAIAAQITALAAQLDNSATAAQIAALAEQISGAATSDAVADLAEQIAGAATADQIADLTEALFPTQDGPLADSYAEEAYEKLVYIDKVLKDRDCVAGEQFKLAQKWIIFQLMEAGYTEGVDIVKQDTTLTKYYKKAESAKEYKTMFAAADSYDISVETYNRQGRNYVVAEGDTGEYVKVTTHTPNIIVTKQGNSEKQIIVGAHYDGDGTGDNGSSIALAVTTAQHLFDVETEYTIKFVFFTAEEYGLYGSTAYVDAMSEEEIANTLYMINMDSLVCGDYCYLYGGIQDDENMTVTQTEAYDNAMAIAAEAGLDFKSNPWTYENPAPGYDVPDYASPSTGDWSDHAPFKYAGINYIYFEATNWDIPGPYYEYDGYGETYLVGMLMNTSNDYLEYIETYFPGRPLEHLTQYSTLLNLLLTQSDYPA